MCALLGSKEDSLRRRDASIGVGAAGRGVVLDVAASGVNREDAGPAGAAPLVGRVETPDQRNLTTFTWGSGPALVVLEAGMGFSGRYWGPVARLIPAGATVVAYDRAGIGRSTPDRQPRTLDRLAADLQAVVDAHGGPVVLVGHSWGGPVVRRAAALQPAGVVGVVLVDPADEGAAVYGSRLFTWSERMQAVLLPAMARFRLLGRSFSLLLGKDLPEPERSATIAASSTVEAAKAAVEEGRHLRAGLQVLQEGGVPDVRVTVISGVKRTRGAFGRKELVAAHRLRAAAFPAGRFVGASGSQHLVPVTEPEVVAREIAALLD